MYREAFRFMSDPHNSQMRDRRIIQVAIDPTSEIGIAPVIYVLCDDGSLWCRQDLYGKLWERLPGVPADEQEAG
jgi:hypothetical protein